MGYLDTLVKMQDSVGINKDFLPSHKVLMIELIEKEKSLKLAEENAFVYFYTNILEAAEIFDFSSVLGDYYDEANGQAIICLNIFIDFASLEDDQRLRPWLQGAIKFVDFIVIHYLQEVLKEAPVSQGDVGKERSRYIQINRKGVKAQKAGRVMDNLYDERNKMEHVTKTDPNDPNKQILFPPKFSKVRKNIQKRFPEALESFNEAFKEYYDA